ncbi:MAG TPA: arsenate reductase ArsC [Candidatus Dormibacteraeota bacterium]|nr:arsenate reductase ArsC [Candidatus Dormibacteraeota bacterium]
MKPKILFLCTGNSARSQMAEGFLRHMAGDRFEALSAGTEPTTLNPVAAEVMREAAIDISGQRSKSVAEFLGKPIQYVVTVCANAKEKCPIFPATFRVIHWDLEDPAAAEGSPEEKLAVFRNVRDQIRERIEREFGGL